MGGVQEAREPLLLGGTMKYCPFKMANPELADCFRPEAGYYSEQRWNCEQATCQLWNERFGECSFAVEAYLKGQEDRRAEKEALRQ